MRGTINATPVRASASGGATGLLFDKRNFSELASNWRPLRQTVMVKRRLRNTLQSSFHIGSGSGSRALERMTSMNSRNLARRIALAAATIGFVPLATLCNLAVPAAGADFGQPFPGLAPPLAADRVEFASNWYVRGDLAYAQETYPNIAPGSPSVLNTFSAGVGGGYKVNNYFRTDLILDYRSPIHAAGNGAAPCFTNVSNPPPTGNPCRRTASSFR